MSSRFECPQCQFVFVAKEAAFSDCVQCGAMALPAGQATSSNNLFSGEATADDLPVIHSAGPSDMPPAEASTPGIFGNMLEPNTSEGAPFEMSGTGDHSSPKINELPASFALTRGLEAGFDDNESITNADIDQFDPFADVSDAPTDFNATANETRVQDVPDSLKALARAAKSGEGQFVEDTVQSQVPAPLTEPPNAPVTVPSSPGPLDADALFSDVPHTDSAPDGSQALDEHTVDQSMEQPPLQPSLEDVPLLIKDNELAAAAPVAPTAPPTAPPVPSATTSEGFWDPNYTSDEIQPGAILLHQLEAQMQGQERIESLGDLDDASFDMLEAAFDDAAGSPDHPEQSRAENALIEASAALAMSSATLPIHAGEVAQNLPAPNAPSGPPPLNPHAGLAPLSFTDETLAAIALPILDSQRTTTTGGNLALGLTRAAEARAEPRVESRPPAPAPAPAVIDEDDDDDPALSVEIPETPPLFRGFSVLKVGGIILVALAVGIGLGALLAPGEKKDTSARGLATEKFARGNQAFSEGRYDEALGFYRGATAIDPTFVDAHRAKAIALAKDKSRQEEAASAYQKYLQLAGPSATDRGEVERMLKRYNRE